MPWNVPLYDSAGVIKDARITAYGAPPGYEGWLDIVDAEMQITSDNHERTTPAAFTTDSAYAENSYKTIYYDPLYNTIKYEEWLQRTGRTGVTVTEAAKRHMLQIYMVRVNSAGAQGRRRSGKTLYYSLNGASGLNVNRQYPNGTTLGAGTLTSIVQQDFLNCVRNFSYGTIAEPQLGPYSIWPNDTGRGAFVNTSRPYTYAFDAMLYYRDQYAAAYPDLNTALPSEEYFFWIQVANIYRWMREQWQPYSTNYADSAAMFMMQLDIHSLSHFYEQSLDLALDPDRFMPNVGASAVSDYLVDGAIPDGQSYLNNGSQMGGLLSEVLSPYTSTSRSGVALLDMLMDFMDWMYGSMDMTWTFDTTTGAYNQRYDNPHLIEAEIDERTFPQSDTTYLRCHENHLARNVINGPDAQRYLGDPMMMPETQDLTSWNVLYRSGGQTTFTTNSASVTTDIQIQQCHGLWWLASALHRRGVASADVQKYMRWGDAIFLRQSTWGPRGHINAQQRHRNQHLYYTFLALEYRNIVTGRND